MQHIKSLVFLFIALYYCFGATLLPKGDFAVILELPAMYQHCKATEDKDMNIVDFVTDHLINIDCLFDAHDNNDAQKPHQPTHLHPIFKIIFCTSIQLPHIAQKYLANKVTEQPKCDTKWLYGHDFTHKILRPPIV